MSHWRWSVLTLLGAFLLGLQSVDSSSYRAAVLEYNLSLNETLSQEEKTRQNILEIVKYIRKAASQQAQIIVFPENGLTGGPYEIPDPGLKVVIANNSSYSEALRNLSSEAQASGIYVVLNVREHYEENGTEYTYNTDIVFDKNGSLVARYRKFNLFSENSDRTSQPEHSVFTTDFNVTFGLFTCFDFLFGEPSEVLYSRYGVRDFAVPVHWFSEMPFLNSIQEQFAWSFGHDVNLLVSGYKKVVGGSAGSGIYRGRLGDPLYSMNSVETTALIVGDLPIRGSNAVIEASLNLTDYIEQESGSATPDLLKREPEFEAYSFGSVLSPLSDNRTSIRHCDGDFCCHFNVTFTQRTDPIVDSNLNLGPFKYHRPVVRDGVRVFPPATQVGGVQICGVIGCLTKDLASCSLGKNNKTVYTGVDSIFDDAPTHFNDSQPDQDADDWIITEIRISGNFLNNDTIIIPNAFLASKNSTHVGELPKVKDLNYTVTPNEGTNSSLVEFKLGSDLEVVNCGIYSRVLFRDTTTGSASLMSDSFRIIITFLLLLPLLKYTF